MRTRVLVVVIIAIIALMPVGVQAQGGPGPHSPEQSIDSAEGVNVRPEVILGPALVGVATPGGAHVTFEMPAPGERVTFHLTPLNANGQGWLFLPSGWAMIDLPPNCHGVGWNSLTCDGDANIVVDVAVASPYDVLYIGGGWRGPMTRWCAPWSYWPQVCEA
jgi:hypothetical protein